MSHPAPTLVAAELTSARVIVNGEAYKMSTRQLQLLEKGRRLPTSCLSPSALKAMGGTL
jgi:hypothetical protein